LTCNGSAKVEYLICAIHDRARWAKLLMDAAARQGTNIEQMAREAFFKAGTEKAEKYGIRFDGDMEAFIDRFLSGPVREVLDARIEINHGEACVEFRRCPLLDCWKEMGCTPGELDDLCDWAMEGDRGIVSCSEGLGFRLEKRLGAGDDCCRLVFLDQRKST